MHTVEIWHYLNWVILAKIALVPKPVLRDSRTRDTRSVLHPHTSPEEQERYGLSILYQIPFLYTRPWRTAYATASLPPSVQCALWPRIQTHSFQPHVVLSGAYKQPEPLFLSTRYVLTNLLNMLSTISVYCAFFVIQVGILTENWNFSIMISIQTHSNRVGPASPMRQYYFFIVRPMSVEGGKLR